MGTFKIELKKVVDDSYDIEIGFGLEEKLISDIKNGLVGNITKFAVVTDSIVKDLYAVNILGKLKNAGYPADLFVFEAGEKSKTRKTKELIEDAMLGKGISQRLLYYCRRRRCCNRFSWICCGHIWTRCTIY